MDVAELIEQLGSTPSATARSTGLSRMTVLRVRDGVSSPSLTTLRELALAAGFDLDVSLVPASDPAAAMAARVIADPTVPELGEWDTLGLGTAVEVKAITEWVARLERQVDGDRTRLLPLAGRYSAPQHRKGARFFAPKPGISQSRLIDIASSAIGHLRGALSGVAAAQFYLGHAPDPGVVVAWTTDVAAVANRLSLTLREVDEYQPAGVIVAPTMGSYLLDMVMPPQSTHPLVSPIQTAIDFYGLGYDLLADEITEGW